ncbi:MAG: DUF1835 domain-containing protein [Janthinobacterium lividum]
MSFLHVVNGERAAALLSHALADSDRGEQVLGLEDDLSVGPLRTIDESPANRIAFWQRVAAEPSSLSVRRLENLDGMLRELVRGRDEIVFWHGQSPGDQILLRRVAYQFRNTPQRLNEIGLGAKDKLPIGQTLSLPAAISEAANESAVAAFPVEAIMRRLNTAAPISLLRIGRLALEWQEMKQMNNELRRWHGNTFQSGTFEELDSWILNELSTEWRSCTQVAARVWQENEGFSAPDSVVCWRCRELHTLRRLSMKDAEHPHERMVRLVIPGAGA